jgi:hypothetical protein
VAVRVVTVESRQYILEFKDSLEDPSWNASTMTLGTGAVEELKDPEPLRKQRFYRVRVVP